MGDNTLCFGCMENIGTAVVCPYCNYAAGTPFLPSDIEPGTVLHNRYTVGKTLSYNGEGITYIGYDAVISCKIIIREYMPKNLCTRVKGKPVISVNYNNLAQYKALMAEFTELNKSLAKMRNLSHIVPALDLFSENNTTYAIFEHFDSVRLIDHLRENAGELSWNTVSKLFPTLFTTLGILHNTGIIHRGISPETIYYTSKGDLKLRGFCVSSVRTANTELEAELFSGYAAPEQYSLNAKQGTWTDVYGICATLYRILTGCMPTDAQSRLDNDNLCPPHELNSNIPVTISQAIMKGLILAGRERTQNVTDLVTSLFEQQSTVNNALSRTSTIIIPAQKQDKSLFYEPNSQTAPVKPDILSRKEPKQPVNNNEPEDPEDYEEQKDDNVERIKTAVIIGVLILAILMVIAAVVLNLFDTGGNEGNTGTSDESTSQTSVTSATSDTDISSDTSASETTNHGNLSIMPSLINNDFELKKVALNGWINLEPVYEFNEEYEKGLIFDQEIPAGETFATGSTVRVWVSKGSRYVKLPNFNGMNVDSYIAKLNALEIPCEKKEETDTDLIAQFSDGVVSRTSAASNIYDLQSGETLIVYYVVKPETSATSTTPEPGAE